MVSAAALKDRIAAAKGKVLVINFWATWCPPCINEMPELAKFYSAYKDKLVFISISADHPETIEKNVRPFLAKMSLPFPIEVVSEADPGIVSETLGIENWVGGLPATFVYDAAGNLHKEWYEEVTQETLRSVVDPLL